MPAKLLVWIMGAGIAYLLLIYILALISPLIAAAILIFGIYKLNSKISASKLDTDTKADTKYLKDSRD